MAATVSITNVIPQQDGSVIAHGTATLSNVYITATGEVMDLSSVFSGSPTVLLNADDGYQVTHNRGTASAGAILASYSNGAAAAGAASIGVTNATDLSAVILPFAAFGLPVLS